MKSSILGLLILAAWLTPASASTLYTWEGEGCLYYNHNIYGGDGDGGCGHRIVGSLRMPDSYVPGTVFSIDTIRLGDELPHFYFYMHAWSPFHPEIRGEFNGFGSILLPASSGPASISWCDEGCTVFGFWTEPGDTFRMFLDEAFNVVGTQRFTLVPTYAPEPGTLAMLGLGLAGLGLGRRRKA